MTDLIYCNKCGKRLKHNKALNNATIEKSEHGEITAFCKQCKEKQSKEDHTKPTNKEKKQPSFVKTILILLTFLLLLWICGL